MLIPTFPERAEWVFGQILFFAPFDHSGPHIHAESVAQEFFRVDLLAPSLKSVQRFIVDQRRFGDQFLRSHHGLNRGLNLRFIVVRLVNHVGDVGLLLRLPFVKPDLVEDTDRSIQASDRHRRTAGH